MVVTWFLTLEISSGFDLALLCLEEDFVDIQVPRLS